MEKKHAGLQNLGLGEGSNLQKTKPKYHALVYYICATFFLLITCIYQGY